MFSALAHIRQLIQFPFFSEFLYIQSAAGGLGQVVDVTFANENVQMIYVTNILIEPVIQPTPAFQLTDNFGNVLINIFGAGAAGTGNFYNLTKGERLFFQTNNANVAFNVQFQKVYSSAEKFKRES